MTKMNYKPVLTMACAMACLCLAPKISAQIDSGKNLNYYMLNKSDAKELPAVSGRQYLSADDKIVSVEGNRMKAISNGDCMIYALSGGEKTEFALVTVGWGVQNPVLPYSWKMYVPDPEVHNFGGKLYVYGSLDASSVFCSPYYISLMTADLKRWESYGYSFSSFDKDVDIPFPERILWDSDGHFHNGKYFLYGFFDWQPGKDNNTFVLESASPMGPFKNFRWMIDSKSNKPIDGISMEVFTDDDGQRYGLYAPTANRVEDNYPVIARMLDDNVIDESSATILSPYIRDFYEAPSLRKRGDTYYFVYAENCGKIVDGKNNTPKRLSYATSKNVFGPYTYRGVIITIEDIQGNTNIQGSIEPLGDQWYVFYHRALNGVWNKRSLCVEKIEFDNDGLIIPVVPTSSGVAEGLDTSRPVWCNTAVFGKNYRYVDEGKFGKISVNSSAEIGFRYIAFTGKEKRITLQGDGLENLVYVKIIANGKVIGERRGNGEISLKSVPKGKAELTVAVTTVGDVKLETINFAD